MQHLFSNFFGWWIGGLEDWGIAAHWDNGRPRPLPAHLRQHHLDRYGSTKPQPYSALVPKVGRGVPPSRSPRRSLHYFTPPSLVINFYDLYGICIDISVFAYRNPKSCRHPEIPNHERCPTLNYAVIISLYTKLSRTSIFLASRT